MSDWNIERPEKIHFVTPNGPTRNSPDDIGHGGGWWQTPDQTPNSDFGAHFQPYYPSSPEIGYGPDSPTPYTPGSPFFSEPSDPIWGTQEPPWQPPTPTGESWSDEQWNEHFGNLPQPGWTDAQWHQFLGGSTDTIPPYTPTPNSSFDDHINPIFGPIPEPWDGTQLTPTPNDSYEMPPPYNPDYVPGYTDPIADDWIANYQTPPNGPVNTGWDDFLNAGYEGES